MNIIFLTRRFYPQIGGVEAHVLELSKKLVSQGQNVTVIAEYPQYISKTDNVERIEQVDGINIIRINAGQDEQFKKFRIWKELWRIRNILQNADIIHAHDVFFWYMPFRIIFPQIRSFVTFHGYETKFPPEKKAIFIRKISEWLSIGNICIGDYIKKWYGANPDFVLYGGVAVEEKIMKFAFEIGNRINILLIGRFNADIGIKTYLKSLDTLRKKKVKYDFCAVGEGTLKKQIQKFGKVITPTKDIYKIISNADIVFSSSYLSMLEALSAKKIVISVFENPLKEDYLKNSPFASYIYICKNAIEVSDVVMSIYNDPWKNETMVENGYKWAADQTWGKITDTYLSLWKK